MSKYYATCGSQTLVISAPNAAFAAMRLIDEAMSAHIWIYDDSELNEQERRDHLVFEALLHLGSSVTVSERGFSRDDAGTFEVPELLDDWHRLMTGLSRMFVTAGLEPRRILPPVAPESDTPPQPR